MSHLQNYEVKSQQIRDAFMQMKQNQPNRLKRRLDLSWSNWGFGLEDLAISAERLKRAGLQYVELHGNHYAQDLGYKVDETKKILAENGLQVSGICGMFSPDNDLSSNRPVQRQAAIDYLRREIEFAHAVDADYILVVPGAVGRPEPYDASELARSVESLRMVGDLFLEHKIRAAIEPIRSAEVSFIHTISDAKRYISTVNHPGIQHINGDVYHMQSEEVHIGEALLDAGDQLTNLHIADSHRGALGLGSLDLDTVIMALYVMGYNEEGRYVTPEPLGAGSDPYPAMYGRTDPKLLDELVLQTVRYFREREETLLSYK